MSEHENELPIEETIRNHPEVLRKLRALVYVAMQEKLYPGYEAAKPLKEDPKAEEIFTRFHHELYYVCTKESEILDLARKYELDIKQEHIDLYRKLAANTILKKLED